jgi:hypothetical protein
MEPTAKTAANKTVVVMRMAQLVLQGRSRVVPWQNLINLLRHCVSVRHLLRKEAGISSTRRRLIEIAFEGKRLNAPAHLAMKGQP